MRLQDTRCSLVLTHKLHEQLKQLKALSGNCGCDCVRCQQKVTATGSCDCTDCGKRVQETKRLPGE